MPRRTDRVPSIFRAALLLCLIPSSALADPRSIPAAADLDAAAATARYAAWRQRLKAFGDHTEKTTNRKLPAAWREAFDTGWWPWWAEFKLPDLTPKMPKPKGIPWWADATPPFAIPPLPARTNIFVPAEGE